MPAVGAAGLACPRCGAAARAGAPWCTQCYLDLRPAATPTPVDEPPAPAVPPAAPRPGPRAAGWPCTGCGVRNGLDADACAGCGSAFLAELRAADAPAAVLPVLGDVLRWGRGQRAVAALVAVLAAVLLAALLGLLTS